MNENPCAIKTHDLVKSFSATKYVEKPFIEPLDLTIPSGQIVVILGSNGSGKTTLLKLLAGLSLPTRGQIFLNQYELTAHRTRPMALQQKSLVLENAQPKLTAQTVHQYLIEAQSHSREQPSVEQQLGDILCYLRLWSKQHQAVDELSFGEQKRLMLATALLEDTPILLLDEPFAGIDEDTSDALKDWLLKQVREKDKTVVLTTRYPSVAKGWSDQIAILNEGRLVTYRAAADLCRDYQARFYEITVKGHFDNRWRDWFGDLSIKPQDDGVTTLTGCLADQAALHGALSRVRDLGLSLISVTQAKPDLASLLDTLMHSQTEKS